MEHEECDVMHLSSEHFEKLLLTMLKKTGAIILDVEQSLLAKGICEGDIGSLVHHFNMNQFSRFMIWQSQVMEKSQQDCFIEFIHKFAPEIGLKLTDVKFSKQTLQ